MIYFLWEKFMRYLKQANQYNELLLLVDKSEITSNFNRIMSILNHNFENRYPTFICIGRSLDSDADPSSNYLYSQAELQALDEIERFYQSKGLKNALKFSELSSVENENDFKSAWSYSLVKKANRNVDTVVEYMKRLKLTPFEAMLFVHTFVGKFQYNSSKSNNKWQDEISRVILGIALKEGYIVCSGHASFGKAVIDKYNDPNLVCDFSPLQFMDKNNLSISAHEQLVVTINDEKYHIKGMYGDDICANVSKDGIPDISTCLFPLEDLNNYKMFFARIMNFNNRYEAIINPSPTDRFSDEDVQSFINANLDKNKDLVVHSIIRRFERQVDKNAINSEPIPYDSYFNALFTIMYKEYCVENNLPFDKYFNISNSPASEVIDDATINSFNDRCYQTLRKSIQTAQSLFPILKSRNTFCLAPYYERDPMIENLKIF